MARNRTATQSEHLVRMTLEDAQRLHAANNLSLPERTDQEIERAAKADPDAQLATDEELAGARRFADTDPRVLLTLRVPQSIVDLYKATGKGWQTRMNTVLAAGVDQSAADLASELEQSAKRTIAIAQRVRSALNARK